MSVFEILVTLNLVATVLVLFVMAHQQDRIAAIRNRTEAIRDHCDKALTDLRVRSREMWRRAESLERRLGVRWIGPMQEPGRHEPTEVQK